MDALSRYEAWLNSWDFDKIMDIISACAINDSSYFKVPPCHNCSSLSWWTVDNCEEIAEELTAMHVGELVFDVDYSEAGFGKIRASCRASTHRFHEFCIASFSIDNPLYAIPDTKDLICICWNFARLLGFDCVMRSMESGQKYTVNSLKRRHKTSLILKRV